MRPASLTPRQEVDFLDEFLQAQLHGTGALGERHDLTECERFVIG